MSGGSSSVAFGIAVAGFGPALASVWPLVIALFLLGFGVAFAVTAFLFGRRPAVVAEPEVPIVEEGREREALAEALEREMEEAEPIEEELAPEELPPAPVAAPVPEDRAERLRVAFESGRITREAYEGNLRRLGLAAPEVAPPEPAPAIASLSEPEPAPPPAPPEGVEAKVARLQVALESGRITRAAYEANLRRLGVTAPVEAPEPSEDELRGRKVERIEAMFAEGRIPRAAYEQNLRKLGVEPKEERAPEELPPEPTPAPPTVEERVAKLRAAFQAGRIPREAYESNLRKLGVEPEAPPEEAAPEELPPPVPAPIPTPEDRIAKLRAAFEAGRITRPTYESNLRKLGVEPEPEAAPEPIPAPAPGPAPPVDDRVARLRAAYVAGRIPRGAYESNLRKLGVALEPVPTPAAPPVPVKPPVTPAAERAAKLHEAYGAGRLTRALYVRNVRALGVEPMPEPAPEAPPVPPPPVAPAPPPAPAPVPPPAATPEEKIAKLRAAFAAGRISREAYVANAKALGYGVRALGLEMAVEAPVPRPALSREERLGRMHVAYRAGRMPRDTYVKNVTALGGTPLPEPAEPAKEPPKAAPTPEERAAKLRAALEAGRLTPQAYEANLAKLGLAPPPPPAEVVNPPAPEAVAPPTNVEERADLLTSMFVNGRISRAVYEKNLGRVYEGADPRLVRLRLALADGRIPRETYEANARRLRGGT